MKTVEMTLGDLAFDFDNIMSARTYWSDELNKFVKPEHGNAIGFTIGRGKQLHWYITPSGRTGKYRCHQHYDDGNEIGRGRYCYPETKITIHYKDKKD